jgi:hypothetical protein
MANTTIPIKKETLFVRWFTPHSTDPEESFREQAIRYAFLVVALLRLLFVVLFLPPTRNQKFQN